MTQYKDRDKPSFNILTIFLLDFLQDSGQSVISTPAKVYQFATPYNPIDVEEASNSFITWVVNNGQTYPFDHGAAFTK